jgi:sugar phosphate isomerase/epimerase
VRFAICNEMFEGWTFADVCEAVRDAGYSGIEIAPFTLGKLAGDVSGAERDAIRETAQGTGLDIVGLHWSLAKTTGFHINTRDRDVRSHTAAYLIELANLCADLGGAILVFGSPKQRDVLDGVTQAQAWKYAVETFRAVVPALEDRDVTLCLEPLAPEETNFINTADDAARMISEIDSPRFQLLLDVKAMSSETKPIGQIIRENRSIVKHFHANDANLRGPGSGNTDFVPIAAALREIEYIGWVSVEVFDFSPDPVTIAVRSMEYLKSVFGTL